MRLRHSAWTYEGAAIESINILSEDDLQYLWLPLAHVFGKVLLALPLQIGFPTAIDGRIDKIVDNLAVVQPTFMGAAPRIFEKAYGRIQTMMADEGGVKDKLFDVGQRRRPRGQRAARAGQEPAGLLPLKYAVADKLVVHQDPRALRRHGCASSSPARPRCNQDIARVVRRDGDARSPRATA